MIQLDISKLKSEFNVVADAYAKAFVSKHSLGEYQRDLWVSEEVGGILYIDDMFINYDDIRYDIDNDIDTEKFWVWYWGSLECHEIGLDYPNYRNYCKGAPVPCREAIDKVKALRKELMELTNKPIIY